MTSATFARSARARALLKHLIEIKLSGDSSRLKGSVLAIEVFGKTIGADSSAESVVRVQVGRLRELLERYYDGEGADASIRIAIPRGSYVPEIGARGEMSATSKRSVSESRGESAFEGRSATLSGETITLPKAPDLVGRAPRSGASDRRTGQPDTRVEQIERRKGPPDRRRGQPDRRKGPSARSGAWSVPAWVALGVLALIAVLPYALDVRRLDLSMASLARPANDVAYTGSVAFDDSLTLPAVFVTANADDPGAQEVTRVLEGALSGFDVIRFFSDPRLIPRTGGVTPNVFRIHVTRSAARNAVEISLYDDTTGRVLQTNWIETFQMAQPALNDRIASILTALIALPGTIYAVSEQEHTQTALMNCLLRSDRFKRSRKAEELEGAYNCYEALLANGKQASIIYSQMASLETDAYVEERPQPRNASLEHALSMARRALELGPSSAYAHREMSYIYARMGKAQESLRWGREAYKLNPFNLSMLGSSGCASLAAERYEEAATLSGKAIAGTSSYPDWWDFCSFAANIMLGHTAEAANAAEAIDLKEQPQYLMARIIGAHLAGRREQAGEMIAELTREHPDFVADPRQSLRRLKLPDPMIDRMLSALRAAGFAGGS